jgi:NAD(P)-dependent dehydrogenase (short-subunit alcohol dehydrogenase family)
MKTLSNAVAVVTGAGSGIGRALAQNLASHGAQLALADNNAATLEETRKLLGSTQVKTYSLDVSDAAAVEAFARRVENDFGRVSLVINNAGVALYGNFAELNLEEFEWLIRINFFGVVYGCKFFLPVLQRQPDAHIVNISSVFGLIAPGGQSAYGASKFAVRGFTQALRLELKGTNINVMCVHPGGIRTHIADNARPGAATRQEEWAPRREIFNNSVKTTPEKAAQVIVNGILRNKARVLIGGDAYYFDFLQRLLPVGSGDRIVRMFERRGFKVAAPQPAVAKEKGSSS